MGKRRRLCTPLGAASNRAFQAFPAKPPAMPADIHSVFFLSSFFRPHMYVGQGIVLRQPPDLWSDRWV